MFDPVHYLWLFGSLTTIIPPGVHSWDPVQWVFTPTKLDENQYIIHTNRTKHLHVDTLQSYKCMVYTVYSQTSKHL